MPAKAAKGAIEVAAGNRSPDRGRRDVLSSIDRYRRHDGDIEAAFAAEALHRGDVTGAIVPEAVIVTHEQVVHAETTEQDLVDKPFRAERGEGVREWQDRDEVHTRLREHLQLFVADGEEPRRGGGVHDLEGMRVECNQQAVNA